MAQSAAFNYGATPQTTAFPANVQKGSLLVAVVGNDQFGLPTVTDTQGNTWSEATNAFVSGFFRTSLWWAKTGAAGPDSVIMAASNAAQVVGQIYEITGIASNTPVDQANQTTSTGGSPITGPTFNGLAGATDFVIHWAFYTPSGNTPVGGIWTSDYTATVGGNHFVGACYAITGPNVPGPTLNPGSNSEFVLCGAAFHP